MQSTDLWTTARAGALPAWEAATRQSGAHPVLAAMATLRLVSLHATAEPINTRLAGLTLGRLVDALGLGLIASGARRGLREPRTARP